MAPANLCGRQPESLILILKGQKRVIDLTFQFDVWGQEHKPVADAEAHCWVHYWKASECCDRAKCIPNPRGELVFCELNECSAQLEWIWIPAVVEDDLSPSGLVSCFTAEAEAVPLLSLLWVSECRAEGAWGKGCRFGCLSTNSTANTQDSGWLLLSFLTVSGFLFSRCFCDLK